VSVKELYKLLVKGDNPIIVPFSIKSVRWFSCLVLACGLNPFLGCVTSAPENKEDICTIFEEKGGWYNYKSHKYCGIKPNDAYHLYLAYHEGHGGFNRRKFKNKAWLKKVAKKVSKRSNTYRQQLQRCQKRLEGPWWWPFWSIDWMIGNSADYRTMAMTMGQW